MKTNLSIVLSFLLILTFCKQVTTHEGRPLPPHPGPIKITGAFALYPLMQVWIKEFHKTRPYIQFDVQAIGSGRGLNQVIAGKTDLAMVSSEIATSADSLLWVIPVARLGVVPVISPKNPYMKEIQKKGIKKDDLTDLFSNHDPKTWGSLYGKSSGDPVRVYVRSDSSGATDVLARYLWLQPNELKGQAVDGEEKMMEAVKNDPFALGYCNFIYAIDVKTKQFRNERTIIPFDINQNGKVDIKESFYDSVTHLQRAMWLGRYPCALTRNLYLVSKGKPDTREEVEFLTWILMEGQLLVPDQGYVELHSFEIPPQLYSLKN